jgi:hypothetical protein
MVKNTKRTLEDANDRLYRNLGKKLPIYAAQRRRSQISDAKMYSVGKTQW